jgi:NAD(P) transhydrogenase subunit alpha
MRIAVLAEVDKAETRVAATPETVRKYMALGAEVAVQGGAGTAAGIPDHEFEAAGATVVNDAKAAAENADIMLKVRRPAETELANLKRGATVIAMMDPYGNESALSAMASAGVDAFAMELMPRITRAQVMDVLSSQANLAGYRAVIDGVRIRPRHAHDDDRGRHRAGGPASSSWERASPGLQASRHRPPSRRGRDRHRRAPRRQGAGGELGAKFVAVEDEEFKQAETAAATPRRCRRSTAASRPTLVAAHIAKQDIVITTALIPGRPAPSSSARHGRGHEAGSVIVDLAVERGGNCEWPAGQVVSTTA